MKSSIINVVRGILKLRGGTDNTVVGNVDDKIKVYIGVEYEAIFQKIVKELQTINLQLSKITELDINLDDMDSED